MASKTRKTQAPKSRNEAWMRARLDHSNRELTRPSGKKYSRSVKHRSRQYDF